MIDPIFNHILTDRFIEIARSPISDGWTVKLKLHSSKFVFLASFKSITEARIWGRTFKSNDNE